jgi:hypothetical protein
MFVERLLWAYARWLFRDFSDESEDISLDEGSLLPPPPVSDRFFITQFPYGEVSQERKGRAIEELHV